MIRKINITNFKSIRNLSFECKRINLLIGEPSVGKSNILETLGLFSFAYYGVGELKEFIRYDNIGNLFFNNDISEKVTILLDNLKFLIQFTENRFKGEFYTKSSDQRGKMIDFKLCALEYDYKGIKGAPHGYKREDIQKYLEKFKFYKFISDFDFSEIGPGALSPPHGRNMLKVLFNNSELQDLVNTLINPFGLKLGLRFHENKIELVKQQNNTFFFYPYVLISDTIKRMIFYILAIESNKNSILCFEEPEVHAFPKYIKYLAETVADDPNNNQYFITTHNPYFLLSIIEKVKKEDLAIFLTYYKKDETELKLLTDTDLEEVLNQGFDLFFNLDRFLETDD